MSTVFHQGQLIVNDPVAAMPPAVALGTSVVDAALHLGKSGSRYLLVTGEGGGIAGVISCTELLRYMSRVAGDPSDVWKSRPVEVLMRTRFAKAAPLTEAENDRTLANDHDLPCVPIIEEGRLAGFMTHDNLFVSWDRLEPLIDAATTDEVTNLANRATFNRRIHEEWERSQRSGEPLALLMIDLDHFKEVNDRYGHLVGDELLSMIGACLRRQFRSHDIVARFGGDEFAALCCDCDPDGIIAPVKRLQNAVRKLKLPGSCNARQPTLSIGAAVIASGFCEFSVEDFIRKADGCLYRAKTDGRNCAYHVLVNGTQNDAIVKIESEPVSHEAIAGAGI